MGCTDVPARSIDFFSIAVTFYHSDLSVERKNGCFRLSLDDARAARPTTLNAEAPDGAAARQHTTSVRRQRTVVFDWCAVDSRDQRIAARVRVMLAQAQRARRCAHGAATARRRRWSNSGCRVSAWGTLSASNQRLPSSCGCKCSDSGLLLAARCHAECTCWPAPVLPVRAADTTRAARLSCAFCAAAGSFR